MAKVKDPSAFNARLSPPLFCSTTLPDRPVTVPPTVEVLAAQATATFVTFAAPMVALPLETVQVCVAGCVSTVTS